MEDDFRPFQPVKLEIIGTESGRQRYLRDGWFSAPPVAGWRNNLTACSQRYNLYFVAHQDSVAVFQPSLHSHTLGNRSDINIVPALANAKAKGALDPSRPHSINHLIVGELGSEEILLLSTDSGNVAAYYTAGIQDGIEKEPYKFSRGGRSDLVGIRPFLVHWVYESAWGLSIHKQARMLAVSSNRPFHEPSVGVDAAVTVFAFALTDSVGRAVGIGDDKSTSREEDESEWSIWVPDAANPRKLPDRSRNWKTRLEGHTCNIPSVSFVNSDADREGKYLLSTDIEGITRYWDIWQGVDRSTWDFSQPMRSSCNPFFSAPQAFRGWSVLALDPSGFQVVDTHEAFCGDQLDTTKLADYLDITNSVCRIPGIDRPWASDPAASPLESDIYSEDDVMMYEFFDGEPPDEDDQDVTPAGLSHGPTNSNDAGTRSVGGQLHPSSGEHGPTEESGLGEIEGGEEMATGYFVGVDRIMADAEAFSIRWSGLINPGGYNRLDTSETDVGMDGVQSTRMGPPGTLPAVTEALSNDEGVEIPALHLSASHLRLFDAESRREASVYCSDLLSFQRPVYYIASLSIDRLNMTQYIPELGIVVVGSQIGRVAVCTLTRKGCEGPFGVRVDWILPFGWQEKTQQRPRTHLLGIALGPVQPTSVSEDDDELERPWMQDREDVDSGIITTYDPVIVRLGPDSSNRTGGGWENQHADRSAGGRGQTKCSKRKRSTHPQPRIELQAWPSRPETTGTAEAAETSAVMESWRGLAYSRRYRLMLTYQDHTVMTYELSRGRPYVGHPESGRPNWRNEDEFW